MFELPEWTKPLHSLYCCWRIEKNCNRRRMYWYRKIAKVKLELAEAGIPQRKIEKACRFLSNDRYVRGGISRNAKKILMYLNEQPIQMQFDF